MRTLRQPARWALCVPAILVCTAAAGDTLDRFDLLLERHVTPAGVRYDAWRENAEDRAALADVVRELSAMNPAAQEDPNRRHALYINLYNAKVLELVVEKAPEKSIKDIAWTWGGYGVFFRKYLHFDGRRISLNALEKRLRKESGDPRVHFAVNCASRSCPPLPAHSLRADRLDEQLDLLTRRFLASPEGLQIEAEGDRVVLRLSKLFDWFAGDFEPAGGVEAFVRRYGPETLRGREAGDRPAELTYLKWDWGLNEAVND